MKKHIRCGVPKFGVIITITLAAIIFLEIGCRKNRPSAPQDTSKQDTPVVSDKDATPPANPSNPATSTKTKSNPPEAVSTNPAASTSTPTPITLEEVERDIIDKSSKVLSCKADIESRSETGEAPFRQIVYGNGQYLRVRDDDKIKYRIKETTTTLLTGSEDSGQRVETSTAICDGTHVYTLLERDRRPTRAYKTNASPEYPGFMAQRAVRDLRLLPDDVVDGHPVYVIEGTVRADVEEQYGDYIAEKRVIIYYRKDCGMTVGYIGFDANNEEIYRKFYRNMVIGDEISNSQFEVDFPSDIPIQDRTSTGVSTTNQSDAADPVENPSGTESGAVEREQ